MPGSALIRTPNHSFGNALGLVNQVHSIKQVVCAVGPIFDDIIGQVLAFNESVSWDRYEVLMLLIRINILLEGMSK